MASIAYLCEAAIGDEIIGHTDIEKIYYNGSEAFGNYFNLWSVTDFESLENKERFIGTLLIVALRNFENNPDFEKIDTLTCSAVDTFANILHFGIKVKINGGVSLDNENLRWKYEMINWHNESNKIFYYDAETEKIIMQEV